MYTSPNLSANNPSAARLSVSEPPTRYPSASAAAAAMASNSGIAGGATGGNWSSKSFGGASASASGYGQQTVQSERVLSSNILGETVLGPIPQEENVQYVEIPVIEEIIKHVPKKEVIEVEKRVPKYEYEWVDRMVEVPEVHYVDKTVEVPQVQEVIRHVPVKQVVEVPKEIIRRVPKVETKIVEREVEVPGEIIDVPKPYLVENKVIVPRYTDQEVPTVVAQKLVPVISESENDFVDVDLKEYNPYLVAVDVYVPRPVARHLIAATKTDEHRVVDVPVGQFNTLIKQLNTHVAEADFQELLVRDARGAVSLTSSASGIPAIVAPKTADWEAAHTKGTMHYTMTSGATTTVANATPKLYSQNTQQRISTFNSRTLHQSTAGGNYYSQQQQQMQQQQVHQQM